MRVLQIEIPEGELFNEKDNSLTLVKSEFLQLEHSLVSLSKWESKWCIPFLSGDNKTRAQMIDYVRCMTITQSVKPEVYFRITGNIFNQIETYINAKMSATWFSDEKKGPKSREIITAEIIYYWMIVQNIPMECQKWHLNRLLTLIRVCELKNSPPKKRSRGEFLSARAALNQARKAKFNTKG